jgi:secondary thiamine-phosphate synthase enzyme
MPREGSGLEARPQERHAEPARFATPIARVITLAIVTGQPTEFVDITDAVAHAIDDVGLSDGIVAVQTRHTTTGVLVNENEPLLLDDFGGLLERLAPAAAIYAHDDPACRTVNVAPSERRNGHAHGRAALLGSSETVGVTDGRLTLGRWQRVFFVELDGGQRREVSLALVGLRKG